jgi:hypothetical protein
MEVVSMKQRTLVGLWGAIVGDVPDLTQGERDAVYEAVINLVEARLKKAGSV